jgi:hypothetical protein
MKPIRKLKAIKRSNSANNPGAKVIGTGLITGVTFVSGVQALSLAKTGHPKPMSQELSLSSLFIPSIKSGFKASKFLYNKRLKCSSGELNCEFVYNKKKKYIYIDKLGKENLYLPSSKNLFNVYNKLIKFSKKNNCEYIGCKTWIFVQHPLIAKKLGFKLVSGLDKFSRFLKSNNVSKILGYDFENVSLICKNKNNKEIILKLSPKVGLPLWELNLK